MPRQHTRREFIQQASAIALGSWISTTATAGGADLAPHEKLNIGIIGTGGRGAANLEAVAETENIVALCDVDQVRLGQAAEQHPRATPFADFRKLLEHPGLDAVVVSTPDHLHAHAAIAAMQLGLHVYCEKPVAHSAYEARRMAEVAAQTGVVTQTGNQMHATDRLRQVVEIVRSGLLGPVHEVVCWSNKQFSGGERPRETPPIPETLDWDLWLGPAPYRPYHSCYAPKYWRGWWDFGSGNFGDMGCHILDAPYWALELEYPTSILAAGPPPHPECTPTALVARYDFPARGDKPPVRLTWYDGEWAPPYEMIDDVTLPAQGSLIMGERGQLLFPHAKGEITLFPQEEFAGVPLPDPVLPRPASHHAEWLDACKGRGSALSDFAHGGRMTELLMAGVVAYRLGKRLDWDGPGLRATNAPEADALIRPEFRSGWSI